MGPGRQVINPLYPGLPSGEFMQFIKYQELVVGFPFFFQDILPIFVQVPVQIPAGWKVIGKNRFG
jgi:hypothetical protein